MIFLMNEQKDLILTGKQRSIYKFETNIDSIVFLIPQFYKDVDMKEETCVVECILPNGKGMYKFCEYEEELYKDMLVVKVPITNSISMGLPDGQSYGEVEVYLLFFKVDAEHVDYADNIIRTNGGKFGMANTNSLDGVSTTEFDGIWAHTGLDEVKTEVETLKSDAITDITVDANNNLVVKDGGVDKLVPLPGGSSVIWEGWS